MSSTKKYQFLPKDAQGRNLPGARASGAKDLLLVVTIDLGEGESDQIHVHLSDSVEDLAAAFCRKHKLNEESYVFVIENIKQNIEAVVSQSNRSKGESDSQRANKNNQKAEQKTTEKNSKIPTGTPLPTKKPEPKANQDLQTLYPRHGGYLKKTVPERTSPGKAERGIPSSSEHKNVSNEGAIEESEIPLQEDELAQSSATQKRLGMMNIYDRLYEEGKKNNKLKREGLSNAEVEGLARSQNSQVKEKSVDGIAVGKRLYEDGMRAKALKR